jgi:hypothetical protein
MDRPVFTPIQIGGDGKLDRVQQALADAFAELESRVERMRAPGVALATVDFKVGDLDQVVDYQGLGGHTVFLPPIGSRGVRKSRSVVVMNNGAGPIVLRARDQSSLVAAGVVAGALTLPAGQAALASDNGADVWMVLQTGQVLATVTLKPYWFSPVDSAKLIGATNSVNNLTVGPLVRPTKAMTCRGVRFYWQVAATSPARTLKVSLWDQITGTRMTSATIAVNASGEYSATFSAAQSLVAYRTYLATVWDSGALAASKVHTWSATQETAAGGGYPSGDSGDHANHGAGTDPRSATFVGPHLLYVAHMFVSGDAMPNAANDSRYPTEIIVDKVAVD